MRKLFLLSLLLPNGTLLAQYSQDTDSSNTIANREAFLVRLILCILGGIAVLMITMAIEKRNKKKQMVLPRQPEQRSDKKEWLSSQD